MRKIDVYSDRRVLIYIKKTRERMTAKTNQKARNEKAIHDSG